MFRVVCEKNSISLSNGSFIEREKYCNNTNEVSLFLKIIKFTIIGIKIKESGERNQNIDCK